jgi:hypothetical protein
MARLKCWGGRRQGVSSSVVSVIIAAPAATLSPVAAFLMTGTVIC